MKSGKKEILKTSSGNLPYFVGLKLQLFDCRYSEKKSVGQHEYMNIHPKIPN